jgi:hypothetical protein
MLHAGNGMVIGRAASRFNLLSRNKHELRAAPRAYRARRDLESCGSRDRDEVNNNAVSPTPALSPRSARSTSEGRHGICNLDHEASNPRRLKLPIVCHVP